MKNKAIAIIFFILFSIDAVRVYSQASSGRFNAIQTVVPFLLIAPDSRAGAMGDAGVATSPDVFSMHWNPAKYAFIDGNGGAGISYLPWLRALVPDINIAYLTGYLRIDTKQVVSSSLLYSSLGVIPFTDEFGNLQNNFTPSEWAFDMGYSRLFSENFSGGVAFRFIYSNLTGGIYAGGTPTKAGVSFAADLSGYYHKEINIADKDGVIAFGLNFSNIGSKMSYTDSKAPDFIPMNMRLGTSSTIKLDNYNTITLAIDLNKLLVPTPPVYYMVGDTTKSGVIVTVPKSAVKYGKDPNVSVPVAIFQSFYDAPGGFREEMQEINYSLGVEYWYNNQFALRGGYSNENATKGNRKYFTLGAGFRMNIFALDFSYLIPLAQDLPLARTLRFSMSFEFSSLRNISKTRG